MASETSLARAYQVCARCVMDTTDSAIAFDADSICDHCRVYETQVLPNWHTDERGQTKLRHVLQRIREDGKRRDFDCIIGVSGGVDSSYLTYLARTQFNLRPLVFHVDTGWNSKESVNNVERLIDGLGIELFTEVIDWEEMRDLQLAFLRAAVPHIDTPQDHAIFASMYQFAVKHGIRYILTGANYSTECIRNPVEWMYFQSDSTQLRDIHRRFGTVPLASFPTTNILWHKVYLPYVKGIRVVRPLNYVPYRKEEAVLELVDKLGWQPYPQKHFESRFTAFYEGFWLYQKFGYDVRRVQLSSLILTGQMTRERALEILQRPPTDEATARREFHYVASKLRITVEELKGHMQSPSRSFRDYRSQAALYAVGAKASRLLGIERGGKR
jgi:N-acetyl sugar amidotransferase